MLAKAKLVVSLQACTETCLRKAVAADGLFNCTEPELASATVEVAWSSEELDEQQWPTGRAQEPLEPDVAEADRPDDAATCSSPSLAFRTLTESRSVEEALHLTDAAKEIHCRIVLGTRRPPPMLCR